MSSFRLTGSNALYAACTLPRFLAAQTALGVQEIAFHQMPAHLWLDHERCVGLKELVQGLRAAELTVASFHPGRYQYTLLADSASLQGTYSRIYYLRCMETARVLGCRQLVLRPTGGLLDHGIQHYRETLMENLYFLLEEAGGMGVTLCLQTITPEEGVLLHTLGELQTLCKLLPGLQAAADTLSISCAGESLERWFTAPDIAVGHITFQDGRNGSPRLWGEGVYPSTRYAKELLHSGYSGPVTLIGPTGRYQGDPERSQAQNLARVQALLQEREA